MNTLTICISVSVFILMMTIFYKPAKIADNNRKRLNQIKKSNEVQMDDALEQPFIQRIIIPFFIGMVKWVSNLLPKKKENSSHQKINQKLKLAGMSMTSSEFNAVRLIIGSCLFVGVIFLIAVVSLDSSAKLLIFILALLIALIGPNVFLMLKINRRQEEITNQLPDVMDLLCVSMEAGLGFDSALIKVGERLNGVLVYELNMVHTEISMGKPRRDALRSLAERNPVDELTTFVASLIQAEKLGIPIKNALVVQAQELRVKRRQRAEEKAMKAPVKMLIPLVMFVLPVLFIVLLGPTILQVIDQFGGI